MAMHNLLRDVAVTVSSAITGSTGASNYPAIDMLGYEGIAFVPLISGTPSTLGSSVSVQEATSSAMGDAADLLGTSVALSSGIAGGFAGVEIYRPRERYVRLVHTKTSTADIFLSVVNLLHRPLLAPVTQSTAQNHGVEFFNGPSSGTP
jgi:hypothetical protein